MKYPNVKIVTTEPSVLEINRKNIIESVANKDEAYSTIVNVAINKKSDTGEWLIQKDDNCYIELNEKYDWLIAMFDGNLVLLPTKKSK